MKTRVKDVMTAEVVTVREDTAFKEIVAVLLGTGVSAVPVLDAAGRVRGVVSGSDLLAKEADPTAFEETHPLERRSRRVERRKAGGSVAAELMSAPPVVTYEETAVSDAARELRRHRVRQVPVVKAATGRLVGIVSRSDLLRVYTRPDEEIRRDVLEEVIAKDSALDPARFQVTVTGGDVVIGGQIERRSLIPLLLHAIRRVEGVVCAESTLTYDYDDTMLSRPYVGLV